MCLVAAFDSKYLHTSNSHAVKTPWWDIQIPHNTHKIAIFAAELPGNNYLESLEFSIHRKLTR